MISRSLKFLAIAFGFAGISMAQTSAARTPQQEALQAFVVESIAPIAVSDTELSIGVVLGGRSTRLILSRYNILAPDLKVFTPTTDGTFQSVDVPLPPTYRGQVEGDPSSRVAASVENGLVNAVVLANGETWWIEPARHYVTNADVADHLVYRQSDVLPPTGICGVDETNSPRIGGSAGGDEPSDGNGNGAPRNGPYTYCQIGFDADYEYFLLNGSDVAATVNDIGNVMNIVDLIYEYQDGIHYQPTGILVWTNNPPDPYTQSDPGGLLNEFQSFWNTYISIPRQVAHLFTGRDLDGNTIGIASVGSICSNGAYGLSQSRYPQLSLAGRAALTAHELAHNWNADHCDGEPDCGIMCSQLGGCSHDLLHFGSTPQNAISVFRNSLGCLPGSGLVPDDGFEPNDSKPGAAPIAVGDYDLQLQNNHDYFSFSLCQAATATIRATYSFNMTTTLELRTTETCQLIAAATNSSPDSSSTITRFLLPGIYLIHVHHTDGGPGGPYRLSFSLSAGDGMGAECDNGVRYVRPGGPNCGNGRSWSQAYSTLSDALRAAALNSHIAQIWVAAGTYRPDESEAIPTGTGDRQSAFELRSDLLLFGGFLGNETQLSQRNSNPETNETVLSGFLQDGSRSYNVVRGTGLGASTVLDGFKITGGNCDNNAPFDAGGGIALHFGSPTIQNCLFENNTGRYGAAIYLGNCSPFVVKCTFRSNPVTTNGGAILGESSSNPAITDCNFSGNDATTGSGGGIYFVGGAPIFRRCVFSQNHAAINGGCVYQDGGTLSAVDCVFADSVAGQNGGAVAIAAAAPNLSNCLFVGNQAGQHGGGYFDSPPSFPYLANCTMGDNIASGLGGAIFHDGGNAELRNSIIWANQVPQIRVDSGSLTVGYSDVEGGQPGVSLGAAALTWAAGNIDLIPGFRNPADPNGPDNLFRTNDDGLALTRSSPCIDAGANQFVSMVAADADLVGNPRFLEANCVPNTGANGSGHSEFVDIGSYEFTFPGDLNYSGAVDLADLANLLSHFGTQSGATFDTGDVDGDGDVDLSDLTLLLSVFGSACT